MHAFESKPVKQTRMNVAAGLLIAALAWLSGCADREVELPPISQAETGLHQPGRFVWHDLLTDDLASAKRFYGRLFGWRFTEYPSADFEYSIAWNHGRPISGLVAKDTEPPHPENQWLSLLSVEDVDLAVRRIRRSGGTVSLKPVTAPARGRFAVIRDPEGVPLTVIRTRWGDPEPIEPRENDWFWNELWTEELGKTVLFYRELAGYQIDSWPPRSDKELYLIFKRGGMPMAGAAKQPLTGGRAAWLPYVRVSNLAGTVSRARSLGGKVLIAPSPDIRSGTVAVIADPSGAIFGIQQTSPSP